MSFEQPELKGNHAPAQKITGGVRIPRNAKRISESERALQNEAAVPDFESGSVLTNSQLSKLTKLAYPEEAVRAKHDKPVVAHPNHHGGKPNNVVIFQPQK